MQTRAETREVHLKLRELFDLRAHLSIEVQALLHDEVMEHYDKPNWVRKKRIANHKLLVKADLKRLQQGY